jgi:hypothetical protein
VGAPEVEDAAGGGEAVVLGLRKLGASEAGGSQIAEVGLQKLNCGSEIAEVGLQK